LVSKLLYKIAKFAVEELAQNSKLQAKTANFVKERVAPAAKAGAKLGSATYLQGDYDVIADVKVDCVKTASGSRAIMQLSGGWDELLVMSEFDLDKAIATSKAAGSYPMHGQE